MSYKKENIKLGFNKIKTLVLQRPAKSIKKKKIQTRGQLCTPHIEQRTCLYSIQRILNLNNKAMTQFENKQKIVIIFSKICVYQINT